MQRSSNKVRKTRIVPHITQIARNAGGISYTRRHTTQTPTDPMKTYAKDLAMHPQSASWNTPGMTSALMPEIFRPAYKHAR